MRCIKCGAELSDKNSIFCDKCYKESIASGGADIPKERRQRSTKNNKNNKNNKNRNIILIIIAAILAVVIGVIVGLYAWLDGAYNKGSLGEDLGITSETELPFSGDVKNIALFGLDTRQDNQKGRSDAIIILTIDKKNKQIKMTSIARDTYVELKSGRKDKITHAWAYGGADNAVYTLNKNFKLDITDYASVNFYGFSHIIDYIGGVTIDVDEAERKVMNKTYIPYIQDMGIECEYVESAGVQLLSGGQALAYARNRYTGSDIQRGSRQREVLTAMFDKVKTLNVTKLPKLVDMILGECTTTLSSTEMIKYGTWALFNSPEIRSFGLPSKECGAKGQMINGTSYMVYDLENASNILHEFIVSSGKEDEISSSISSKES